MHFNLVEFLERNRSGMASTFITRLRVGESLVDAKGVSRLQSRRVDMWPLVAFAVIGIAAIVVAVLASPALRNVVESRDALARRRPRAVDRRACRVRDCPRVRLPLPRRVTCGRVRRPRDRDPGRCRSLGTRVRQRRRALGAPGPDRRPQDPARRSRGCARRRRAARARARRLLGDDVSEPRQGPPA